jgi:hypothetical protein
LANYNFILRYNQITKEFELMAIIAEGMAFDAVDATPTAAARVTFALNQFPQVNLNSL